MTSPLTLAVDPALQAIRNGAMSPAPAKGTRQARARAQGEEFEAAFLNSMFQHMYAGVHGEGPFGESTGVGAWRSFLTEQYAKNFVKAGGIGLASQVYQSLLAHQETPAK
jgi:peptidoglycan hydrolase FlgJ